jgi:putative toxin-antitoxin system antitoxin component (TIGR02293 family)
LPATAIDYVVKIGKLTPAEVDRVVIPRKTLAYRRTQGTLTADQSDRFVRVARIISLAEDTFANPTKAATWLRRATSALNGEKPLDLLDTEEGAREVETLLTRIAHGIAA